MYLPPSDPRNELSSSHHDFRNLVAHGKRKKKGFHRIRRCVNCGCIERSDRNTLKTAYQVDKYITELMPACDTKHADIAAELGVDPNEFARSIGAVDESPSGMIFTGKGVDEELARGIAVEAKKRLNEGGAE